MTIDYDPDAPGGPTHQSSVRPGGEHLPVRGQPTLVSGSEGPVLPFAAPNCQLVTLPPHVPDGAWMLHRFML